MLSTRVEDPHQFYKHHSENTGEDFQCNLCDNNCLNQLQFLNHRKTYHAHAVPTCRNYSNGSCMYTNDNCWFKHAEDSHDNKKSEFENENIDKEIIQKLFKMMENFMNQITQMKEMNQLL